MAARGCRSGPRRGGRRGRRPSREGSASAYLHAASYYAAALALIDESDGWVDEDRLWERQRECWDPRSGCSAASGCRSRMSRLRCRGISSPRGRAGGRWWSSITVAGVATSSAWAAGGAAAASRGFHWMTFDGPGRGAALRRQDTKSVRRLAVELRERGHEVHFTTVAHLLRSLGYSLQSNRKTLEGAQHPDRDLQFCLINERVGAAIAAGEPAISLDTKKKELVGEFKNAGREWRVAGEPIRVSTHDFPSQAIGKAIPYGVYDIAFDEGFVNVGITSETAQLAVASIRAWWQRPRLRALPRRPRAADHRRLRRREREPHPPLEDRAAEAR